jgi:hypothetical protein
VIDRCHWIAQREDGMDVIGVPEIIIALVAALVIYWLFFRRRA